MSSAADRARTVAELRPRAALAVEPTLFVHQVAKKMRAASSDSALVVSAAGELVGIVTDTDVARKVIAVGLPTETTPISEIMTTSPHCVRASDSAVDALCIMVERRFRHLPVLSTDGAVVGVLDIAKCLYDAISRLERHLNSASTALSSAVLAAMPLGHGGGGSAQQLVDGMVQKLFSPSLGDLLSNAASTRAAAGEPEAKASVPPTATAREAAALMARRKSAILISDDEESCIGIATPKDLLFRLVAQGLDASTPIAEVMTRAPDVMQEGATVLQALHQLQYGGYRNVPVVADSGAPRGVLDVLTLMEGALLNSTAASGKGGRGVMKEFAETLVGATANPQHPTLTSQPPSRPTSQSGGGGTNAQPLASASMAYAPAPASVHDSASVSAASSTASFLFKVCDPRSEHMHRIHSHPRQLGALATAVKAKLGLDADATLILRYDDDEGDRVVLSSNEELAEAVSIAVRTGKERLVVHPSIEGADGMGASEDKENVAAANKEPAGGSLGGTAARIAGKAASGGKLSSDEKLLGAGAFFAALVLGAGALARGR